MLQLMSFETGPMFRVFTDDEIVLWQDYTNALGQPTPPPAPLVPPARAMAAVIDQLRPVQQGIAGHAMNFMADAQGVVDSVDWWFQQPSRTLMAALAAPVNGLVAPGDPANSRFLRELIAPTGPMGAVFGQAAVAPNSGSCRDVVNAWIGAKCPLPMEKTFTLRLGTPKGKRDLHPTGQHTRHGECTLTGAAQVVVVGSGPAGAACALTLARAGVDGVCLTARRERFAGQAAIGEPIPPDTRDLLDRLGLWQTFLEEGHERCLGSCSTWGGATPGYNDYLLNPQGCGWHLDRRRFDAFLVRHAVQAGVTMLENEDDATPQARFTVDATGRASAVARRHGARQITLDRLSIVYGFLDLPAGVAHSRLTSLEAARDGWWYAAAIAGQRMAVAFAGDAETIRAAARAHDSGWLRGVLRRGRSPHA